MNKLWYKDDRWEGGMEENIASREYIQRYIDLYCPERFSVPEDVTTDNLQEFLEIILKYYQLYLFNMNELINLGESITHCFHKAYYDDFPDTFYPTYPDSDRRQLTLHVLGKISNCPSILPEDVPTLIKCMNVPDEQIIDMYNYIDNYYNQFDDLKRFSEDVPRFDILNKQRLEAIKKGQPLPIRPMGIELNSHRIPNLKKSELIALITKLYNAEENNLSREISDAYPTLRYHNIMTISLSYYIKEKKLSPEEILEKVQAKNVSAPGEAPYISEELVNQIMSEPIILNYDWEAGNLSELHPIDKKYYLSLGTVYQWLQEKQVCKIMPTIDPSELPAYNDHDKVSIIANKYKLPHWYVRNWIKYNAKHKEGFIEKKE